jgi:HEPN domain-containing protein
LLTGNSLAPRSHDLPQLLLLIDAEFDLQSRIMKAAQLLTRVAIRRRYPGNLPEPNLEEAQSIGRATALLREYARLALGLTP